MKQVELYAKARHAVRIKGLRDEHGFTGGITIVKDYVAGWRERRYAQHAPGSAGPSPEGVEAADVPARVRQARPAVRRIKAAKFPTVKSLDSFDLTALPSLNRALIMDPALSEYVERRENFIAVGNSGTGKSHIAPGLGLAACQKGFSVGFTVAAALVRELLEARDEKRLLRLQRQLANYKLLIIDELGYVPLSQTGAELLFEVFGQRYERGSTIATSNLPFDEWTSVFGSERLTGALLDRLTHHVHILEMNGDSFRLAQSKRHSRRHRQEPPDTAPQA